MQSIPKLMLYLVLVIGIQGNAIADCVSPSIPIIPDGVVASKDEMLSASKAIQNMQLELAKYRNCLTKESVAITGADEDSLAKKQALLDLYNQSVDLEQKAADKFNASLKAYNSK